MGVMTRSRVTPGMSWTMLMRLWARALSSELLPTLGRPTMATVGRVERFVLSDDFTPVSVGTSIINSQYCGRLERFVILQFASEQAVRTSRRPSPPCPARREFRVLGREYFPKGVRHA